MLYMFNPSLEEPFCLVHPLQVNALRLFVSKEFPSFIRKIILFGGSLDLCCSPKSDLDLYVIYEDGYDVDLVMKSMHTLAKGVGKPVDLLYATEEDLYSRLEDLGSVENRLKSKGVVVYEKR